MHVCNNSLVVEMFLISRECVFSQYLRFFYKSTVRNINQQYNERKRLEFFSPDSILQFAYAGGVVLGIVR